MYTINYIFFIGIEENQSLSLNVESFLLSDEARQVYYSFNIKVQY